ncbi:MAG: hypothetical protein ACFFDN_40340 [Candidatus Hodarchaeota archaeon]
MKSKANKILGDIKSELYLLIPIISMLFWSLFYVFKENFDIKSIDFYLIYKAGRHFLLDPRMLYDPSLRMFHLPVFVMFIAFGFCFLPFSIAEYLFYAFITIVAIIFIFEYNKILILMDVNEKLVRFLFLMIISNGFIVFYQFFMSQYKFIAGLLMFIVLRRELQYTKEGNEKTYNFYFVNYLLFAFVTAIFPVFIFFLLVYLFQNIPLKDIMKYKNIKKYLILLLSFAIENFIIFIYPSLILDIFNLFQRHSIAERASWGFPIFYLKEWEWLNSDDYTSVILISTILIAVITFILGFYSNLPIEQKFGYFSLIWIIFSTFAERVLVILIPLLLLLLIPFLNQENNLFDFIKNNFIISIGLLSVLAICFMPDANSIYNYAPFLQEFPFVIFMYIRWIVLIVIFVSSFLQTHFYH